MKQITGTLLTILFLCAATTSQANDLSLHPLGKDVRLAAITPAQTTLSPYNSIHATNLDEDEISIKEVDVWVRIRQGFSIPDLDNAAVTNQLERYASRPEYIQRTTARGSRYLFHIVQELEARGMPTELALLPFIESAFNPNAKSTAKAVGMWQFIPSTGKSFNLNQSTFKDERRSVLASTEAALNYLQKLHDMFGDWQLALAAYNWGEGSVQRAIKRNLAAGLPTDFNGLSDRMPAETRNYVPKLQAVKNIIANPGKYGITLPKVENQPFFVSIGKTRDMDVKVAAKLAELSLDDFCALNPQFGKHVITGGTNTQILLPQEHADKFKKNLEKWNRDKKALCSWTSYRVADKNEKLDAIATKFSTNAALLREVNHIPPRMLLKSGSTILVPKSEKGTSKDISPEVVENARIAIVRETPVTRRITIKVGKRDTLVTLAKHHRVSVKDIKTWNKLKSDKIATGSRLTIHIQIRQAAKSGAKKRGRLAKHNRVRGSKKSIAANGRARRTTSKRRAG